MRERSCLAPTLYLATIGVCGHEHTNYQGDRLAVKRVLNGDCEWAGTKTRTLEIRKGAAPQNQNQN